MHQKKSEVQIGKESVGVSSDFNPSPPLQYQKHPHHRHQFYPQIEIDISPPQQRTGPLQGTPPPSLSKQKHLHPHAQPPLFKSHNAAFFSVTVAAKSAAFRALRRVRRQRALLLLAVPLLYLYFLVSRSFLLDLLSAIAFSAALVFSLNLAFPLPLRSIRLKSPSAVVARPAPQLPVFWTIGSRPKSEKRVASGCWVQVFGNGDVYEGEFHRGKCSGSGVYYYSRSGRYEGDWVDGKYDGYGVETWARGSRYRGCYRQGLRHGFGVYRFYTGDVYAGEWSNGQSHGCGVHTCEDGSRYVGEFKWGVKHGLGHYHFRNGDTYAGEYFADKMHGFGIYHFANGHLYEGAWHEGRRQGLGMYTFRNGETQSGHWQNGLLDIPSTQSTTYPVSPVGLSHSKVLNAVQEARRAAAKAYEVAKVDEGVNRAVAASNRAANAARVAAVKAAQKRMHQVNNESFAIPVM
ncbi:phosphatidylinositol 4-phosphate 5-kinase 6 [Vigna radiata var. radiata]|uniref:Phosphatidylinositol 4-phosphate 5-kinase 6 n=1 Tax=Vigna radiata var. radiata TaxID=3916 RepID=A0A1S3VXH2_VIGRR|nr:phosphatidylinositol 4-phosphate 5-kinase 6 [Vigna radiata var. radiata]